MIKKYLCLYLFLTVFFAVGCQKNETRFVGNGANESFKIPEKIERIISITPSNTEIISALGMTERIIAVDQFSADVEGLSKDVVIVDFLNPDAETIIGLQPDVVIANSINKMNSTSGPLKSVEDAGVSVIYIRVSSSLEGVMEDVLFIADVLNVKEKGEDIVLNMKKDIDKIKSIGETITERKTVYFEVEPAPHSVSFGSDMFLHELITITGAKNIFEDQKGFFVVNAEEIIARNPDVILSNSAEIADPVAEIYTREGFENINAVKNKNIYFIDTNESARPSHNVIKGLKKIAYRVYPAYYGEYSQESDL
ncbi:MAG: ABC transporter substrate-binding protein [Spirochaetaceae bacterium]|jgi:iron complex transport system substrate-binding protein|nr:ABC transporter substrate-binding protein [Spirochaetaceae bacterium]